MAKEAVVLRDKARNNDSDRRRGQIPASMTALREKLGQRGLSWGLSQTGCRSTQSGHGGTGALMIRRSMGLP